jgi:hypothetical protein
MADGFNDQTATTTMTQIKAMHPLGFHSKYYFTSLVARKQLTLGPSIVLSPSRVQYNKEANPTYLPRSKQTQKQA